MSRMKLLLVFTGFCLTVSKGADPPRVTTQQGIVEGEVLLSRNGREYYSFLQLPYGKANRFQAPTNPDKHNGVLKANDTGSECAQNFWFSNEHLGIEECLNLHVHSPKLNGSLPVMVYFHGGGFTVSSANEYHEKYFMDEDVVLVLVNYRLGVFGFLSTAVSQSGSALNPWALSPFPAKMASKFGKAVNCTTKSSRGLLNCLLGKSTEELLTGMKFLVEWGYDPFTPFGPVLEAKIPGSFLIDHPAELLKTGKFNRVPWMGGLNEDEGHMMHSAFILANPELSADLKKNWHRIFPITLQFNEVYYNFTPVAQAIMADKIHKFYFGNKPIDTSSRKELTDLFSDRFFNHGIKQALLLASNFTKVFPYIFTHNRGDYTLLKVLGIDGNYGVSHADELTFLFSNFHGEAPEFKKGSASEQVSKNLVKLWVSFARDKKPTALWGSQKIWNPISNGGSSGQEQVLRLYKLDTDTALVPEHFTRRAAFWDQILADAVKQSRKGSQPRG
ncbi:unnamed protein product [Allacma fusca]|uniref:Carboxylesterase type B domain-containing protein n=1 Tax=Allacma fusca TaxID=39272 RepID=A0A8J2LGA8_9HEXA|nr:unnamed protein product [Allacma fusca]